MINVNLVFLFLAGVAFLGFILSALFDKVRITSVLPLMLIGLLVGPVLHLVNVSPSGVIYTLTPFITAITVSFILFEVGMNMRFSSMKKVLSRASAFTFSLVAATAALLAPVAFFLFHWSAIESIIFALAIAGPSSIIVPYLMKVVKISKDLKTVLLYESISDDILTFMLPLVLFGFVAIGSGSIDGIAASVFYAVFGSLVIGFVSALFWLYILNRFNDYSKNYKWMLTITMVIATYGIAQQLSMSGPITSFVFGLVLANIGERPRSQANRKPTLLGRLFNLDGGISHIRSYQKEIVFFVSTFFFVYIGLLFNLSQLNLALVTVAALISVVILFARYLFVPMISGYIAKEGESRSADLSVTRFNVARGMTPAVIATVPLALGLNIPYFLDLIFLVILLTNIISTAGIFATYRPVQKAGKGRDRSGGASPGTKDEIKRETGTPTDAVGRNP